MEQKLVENFDTNLKLKRIVHLMEKSSVEASHIHMNLDDLKIDALVMQRRVAELKNHLEVLQLQLLHSEDQSA